MTYIIEDNFDFFQALKSEAAEPSNEKSCCLITHAPLTYNHVSWPCGHTYNYLPLFNELCLNLTKTKDLICPYCRKVSEKLMPYIQLPGVTRVLGVNSPDSKCLAGPICQWYGKKTCGKKAVEYKYGMYCGKHNIDPTLINEQWTEEMAALQKYKTVADLKEMLKNLGLKCGGGTKTELIKKIIYK